MNPFENFKNPKRPDAGEQFAENVMEEFTGLIDEAKIKAEGVILYAPIPEEVRVKLLEHLRDIKVDDEHALKYFFEREARGMSPDRTASLYIYRKMRGAISNAETEIGRSEAEALEQAVAHLYTDPNEYTDSLHKNYMNRNIITDGNN